MTQVRVEQGTVDGDQEDGVFSFRGIPYAAPPVGERRWAAPQPPAAWDGVRDATNFGNAAIQTVDSGVDLGAQQSEDCLYLNVWSAVIDPQAGQPVMVWIHGGGFLNWAASMPGWHGNSIAERGVTVVSFNYRLGAFGFLDHPEAGGNFAVQDWVAALMWVSRNIRAFGGDPDNVTLFGQSAGAVAVRTLLSTPAAQGLFHRAALQSGGFERPAAGPQSAARRQRLLQTSAQLFGQLGGSDIGHLRAAPVERVRRASRDLSGTRPAPGQVHFPGDLVWSPTPDGQVVGDDLSCWPEDLPVLFGCTKDEARFFITPTGPYGAPAGDPAELYTPTTLANMAKVLGGKQADDIRAHLTGSPYEALAQLYTTAIWTEPALASYRRFTDLGRTSYAYRFARVSPGNRRTGMLAYHTAELPYLFGHLVPAEQYDEVDAQVSDTIQYAWTEFARTGVPRSPDGTPWPAGTTTTPLLTAIDDTTHNRPLDNGPLIETINSARTGP